MNAYPIRSLYSWSLPVTKCKLVCILKLVFESFAKVSLSPFRHHHRHQYLLSNITFEGYSFQQCITLHALCLSVPRTALFPYHLAYLHRDGLGLGRVHIKSSFKLVNFTRVELVIGLTYSSWLLFFRAADVFSQLLCVSLYRFIAVRLVWHMAVAHGRASDLRSRSRGFEARPRRCCATTLGKLFTPYCLCHKAV